MIIALACDHGGLELKEEIKKHLEQIDIQVIDEGTYSLDSCNYAEFAIKAAKDVASKQADLGILVCTSGEGVAIAANKVKGIRCAKINSIEDATLSRNDNGANVMTFNYTDDMNNIKKYIDAFISAEVINDERHQRRVDKITAYEEKNDR